MGILKRDVFAPSKVPQCFIIEVDDTAAGVVVQERSGYRFFAACAAFDFLNRQVFASAANAEAACRTLRNDHGAAGRLT